MTTEGTLLGGRVRYSQPSAGFRSGIEPVLLAASVPARDNERVLEAGTGAGAALLCLMQRVSGVRSVGVELDPALAALARSNAEVNGFAALEVVTGAVETVPLDGGFDHVIANPPYHPAGTASPDDARETAKRGSAAMLEAWIRRGGNVLRPRGSLTLILPAGLIPSTLALMQRAQCPCTTLFPLWPKAGRPAKLVLLRGLKQARTPMRLAAGLVLHRQDGSYTDAAASVLSNGTSLGLNT